MIKYMWDARYLSRGSGDFCVTNFPLTEQDIEISIGRHTFKLWLWTKDFKHSKAHRIIGSDYDH